MRLLEYGMGRRLLASQERTELQANAYAFDIVGYAARIKLVI